MSSAYDVVVAGGGIAGVSAAVAAARCGVSVCLLERACALGGLATLGNVTVWLPLCDGLGRQVTGGLAEELLRLSVAELRRDNASARFIGIPACWGPGGDVSLRRAARFQAEFNPSSYLLALEGLVVAAGVRLLYDTRVCAVHRDADRVAHLLVENKSGRSAIACRTVVDATGDADVCYLAGEPTESLQTNVLAGWFYHLDGDRIGLESLSNAFSPVGLREDAEGPFFRGDDGDQVTAQILGTRELMGRRLAAMRERRPDVDIQVLAPPTIACLRMTRRLIGSFSPGERNVHQWFDDTVGLVSDWRKAGPVYAIPYRSLRGVLNRNVLVAGRCISVDTTLWDLTRSIPGCAVSGQACGVAAAHAVVRCGGDAWSSDVTGLQEKLADQGALLDRDLAAPNPDAGVGTPA